MQQSTRRLAIVFGGSLLVTMGVLAACTDNGTTPLPGQSNGVDSGKTSKGDGSTDPDDEDPGTDDPADAGPGVDCGTAPKLRNNEDGFYCAFYRRDGGDPNLDPRSCANDQVCCNPGRNSGGSFPPSFCADKADGCEGAAAENDSEWIPNGGTYWECADKNACGGGQKCCMFTWLDAGANDKVNIGKSQDKDIPAACNAQQAFKVGGARCADDCNADEIQLCSLSDDNCSGNQKCTPFAGQFRDLGACK